MIPTRTQSYQDLGDSLPPPEQYYDDSALEGELSIFPNFTPVIVFEFQHAFVSFCYVSCFITAVGKIN